MKELDKLLESTEIDELLDMEFDQYSEEEREYLLNKVTEIADSKCFEVGIKYSIVDVELIDKLEDRLKLLELCLTLAYDSKTNFNDIFFQVRMWDVLVHNKLKLKNVIIPPTKRETKSSSYDGAYVKAPIVGMHKWIAAFDLNSLYPHLIMQYNISPETIIEPEDYTQDQLDLISSGISIEKLLSMEVDTSKLTDCTVTPNGQFFRTDIHGFLPEMMKDMYVGRTVYKKKMIETEKLIEKETDSVQKSILDKLARKYNNLQLAKKVCLNSAYGALGNEHFRHYDIRQAVAITSGGQLSIKWIENAINDYMNKILKTTSHDYVIASDTDSIYLALDSIVTETFKDRTDVTTKDIISFMDKICEQKIQPFIDKSFQKLATYVKAYEQKMEMKRETLSDKGLWTAKKRYILSVYDKEGVSYDKPKIKVTGLEMIKSSTPSACRVKLKEAINVIFNGNEDQMIEFIERFGEEFKTLDLSIIAFPRGVNGLEKYKGIGSAIFSDRTPIHVRGSLLYNSMIVGNKLEKKYELIKEGEKIKFIYLKTPNPIQSNIISFPTGLPKELDIHQYIDYNTQFEKSFLDPLKIILNSIGWQTKKTAKLSSFFKKKE